MKKIIVFTIVGGLLVLIFTITGNENYKLPNISISDTSYEYELMEVDKIKSGSVKTFEKRYEDSLVEVDILENTESSYNYPIEYGSESADASQMFSITDAKVVDNINGDKLDDSIKILSYVNYNVDTKTISSFGQEALLLDHQYALYLQPLTQEEIEYYISLGVPIEELENTYAISEGETGTVNLTNDVAEPMEKRVKQEIKNK